MSFCWTLQPPRTALGQCPGTCLSGALKLDLVDMADRLHWLLLNSQESGLFSIEPVCPSRHVSPPAVRLQLTCGLQPGICIISVAATVPYNGRTLLQECVWLASVPPTEQFSKLLSLVKS